MSGANRPERQAAGGAMSGANRPERQAAGGAMRGMLRWPGGTGR
jgi:hypothetical protein